MTEQIPDMEELARNDELDRHIADASARIEHRMEDTAQQTTDAAKEIGLMDALGNVWKEAQARSMSIAWKDAKAFVSAGLSLVPLVGTIPGIAKTAEAAKGLSSAAKAAKATKETAQAANTAYIAAQTAEAAQKVMAANKVLEAGGKSALAQAEKTIARATLWQAAKDIPGHAARHMVEPGVAAREIAGKGVGLARDAVFNRGAAEASKKAFTEAAKKGLPAIGIRGAEWAMRMFDPFPDVPPAIVGVTAVASLLLPGADIVPAVWQLVHNKVKLAETYGKMVIDMGEVVATRLNRDYMQVKDSKTAQAALVFAPTG